MSRSHHPSQRQQQQQQQQLQKQSERKKEAWRGKNNHYERHYCAICNAWMGGDRQSIWLHESGKKHAENVERSLSSKREAKAEDEKAKRYLNESLKRMERTAVSSHMQDVEQYGNGSFDAMIPPNESTTKTKKSPENIQKKEEGGGDVMKSWEARKNTMMTTKTTKKKKRHDDDVDDHHHHLDDECAGTTTGFNSSKRIRRTTLDPNEGHYSHGDLTYLEASTFLDLLEEEIPIELWTGSESASPAEKKLAEKIHHWRKGLVVRVRNSRQENSSSSLSSSSSPSGGKVVDVAYLISADDEEETFEKSVSTDRIRIVLGSDERLPSTLEEARLSVIGEEVIRLEPPEEATTAIATTKTETTTAPATVDENTGLGSWGTVEIRKTTVLHEERKERERQRERRREELERIERERKEAEGRRMEEAKADNAEDSALGAYDVWSGGKAGYKGIDIAKDRDDRVRAEDMARSLSNGVPVAFKKKKKQQQQQQHGKAFPNKTKKQGRRTTFADDD